MPVSVFISHVYEDLGARQTIRAWADRGLLGTVAITGESEDLRPSGAGAIRRHLHPMLVGAGAVVVLVGNNSHNHQWVDYEVDHALSQRKRVVPVRIPGTTGAGPRSVAGRAAIALDPGLLRAALGT